MRVSGEYLGDLARLAGAVDGLGLYRSGSYDVDGILQEAMCNAGLIARWLGCEDGLVERMLWPPSWCLPGIDKTRTMWVYGILAPVLLPRSAMAWEVLYPSHCNGLAVFFAGLVGELLGVDGRRYWKPVIIVSCNHFEHGHESRSLAGLEVLHKFVTVEAFEWAVEETVMHVHILDPHEERFLATVEPELCYDERRDLVHHCLYKRPGKALRLLRPWVRRYVRLRPATSLVSAYSRLKEVAGSG